MATRSKRLWGPTTVGNQTLLLYTCPDNETTLLKCLTVFNNAALPLTPGLKLNGSGGAQTILSIPLAAATGVVFTDLFIVLQPGDTLHMTNTSASVFCAGFGAQLEGVAD